jgi:hypothetical protein
MILRILMTCTMIPLPLVAILDALECLNCARNFLTPSSLRAFPNLFLPSIIPLHPQTFKHCQLMMSLREQKEFLKRKLKNWLARMGVNDLGAMQTLLASSLSQDINTTMQSSSSRPQSQPNDASENAPISSSAKKKKMDVTSIPIIEYYHQLLTSSSPPSSTILHDLCSLCPPISSVEIESAKYPDEDDPGRRDLLVSQKYEMTLSLLLYQKAFLPDAPLPTSLIEDLAMGCALHESFCGYQSTWFIPTIRRLKPHVTADATLILTAMGEEEDLMEEDGSKFFTSSAQLSFGMEQDDERNKENVMPKSQRPMPPEIELKRRRSGKRESESSPSTTPMIARLIAKETPTKKVKQDTRRVLATPPRRKLRL